MQTDDFSEVNLSSSIDEKNMIKFSCKIRKDCCTSDSRPEKLSPKKRLTKEETADQNPVVLGTTPRIIDDRGIGSTKRAERSASAGSSDRSHKSSGKKFAETNDAEKRRPGKGRSREK